MTTVRIVLSYSVFMCLLYLSVQVAGQLAERVAHRTHVLVSVGGANG